MPCVGGPGQFGGFVIEFERPVQERHELFDLVSGCSRSFGLIDDRERSAEARFKLSGDLRCDSHGTSHDQE
jgi:hypothetical protein